MLKIIPCLSALCFLTSCTITQRGCEQGNWYERGQQDGAQGRAESYVHDYQKICSKHGIVVDQSAWAQGRITGLKSYCTIENIYDQGTKGRSLKPVCPTKDLDSLRASHALGYKYYTIGREIDDLERERNALLRDYNNAADGPEGDSIRRFSRTEIHHLEFRIRMLYIEQRRYDDRILDQL
ncbi:hypothetical protein GCM10007939_00420 [Amylibacter marinus]|uniref:DUF2799 domain-containing protein n=1 Tax=Amylibacter marinus TaxID=1475483 RepID=A0ABQ5VQY4_9RHOB|nr:DUF2799 domain-containing protein [Amylibacter marinus]GLQ33759.1 hypothetical protein GCM10007939_00420 [Amylibacter marinus]